MLALAFLAARLFVDRFDAEHPAPAQLIYALDADTGKARWVSGDADPGEWVSKYVNGREDLGAEFAVIGDDVATGPAVPADLPAPILTTVSDETTGGQRTVTFLVRILDGSDGLSGLPGFTYRPDGVGVEGSHDSELVLVGKTYSI